MDNPVVNKRFLCDLSYGDILNSAKPLQPYDLFHVTEIDTLRLLVCNLKEKELKWDIKYHNLAHELERRNPDVFDSIMEDLQ